MEKLKKIAKYTVNIINILNAVWLMIAPIWKLPYIKEVSESLIGLSGVISTYLLANKAVKKEG